MSWPKIFVDKLSKEEPGPGDVMCGFALCHGLEGMEKGII